MGCALSRCDEAEGHAREGGAVGESRQEGGEDVVQMKGTGMLWSLLWLWSVVIKVEVETMCSEVRV